MPQTNRLSCPTMLPGKFHCRAWGILFILLFPLALIAQLTGKVIKVADGDSFTLLVNGNQQVRIRLHGIDCPENGQPYSNVAKTFTNSLIYGKQVQVKQTDTDRYGRIVGVVINPDGVNVNEALLRAGLAWHYKRYDKNQAWERLETEARKAGKGMWQDKNPIPPWEWRKMR